MISSKIFLSCFKTIPKGIPEKCFQKNFQRSLPIIWFLNGFVQGFLRFWGALPPSNPSGILPRNLLAISPTIHRAMERIGLLHEFLQESHQDFVQFHLKFPKEFVQRTFTRILPMMSDFFSKNSTEDKLHEFLARFLQQLLQGFPQKLFRKFSQGLFSRNSSNNLPWGLHLEIFFFMNTSFSSWKFFTDSFKDCLQEFLLQYFHRFLHKFIHRYFTELFPRISSVISTPNHGGLSEFIFERIPRKFFRRNPRDIHGRIAGMILSKNFRKKSSKEFLRKFWEQFPEQFMEEFLKKSSKECL